MSDQASWVKLSHSSLTKSPTSWRLPASSTTTLMFFCASSFARVPPPAPEPMMTTTESSFRSYFVSMGLPSFYPRLQPGDVVETVLDVATLRSRFPLIAKDRPNLLLVIEGHNKPAADVLEEWLALHLSQQCDAISLPANVDIGDAMPLAGKRVKLGNALLDRRLGLRIGPRLHVIALHRDRIETIGETVVWIDVARRLDERSHSLRLEIFDFETPSLVRVDDRGAGNDERGSSDPGKKLPPI